MPATQSPPRAQSRPAAPALTISAPQPAPPAPGSPPSAPLDDDKLLAHYLDPSLTLPDLADIHRTSVRAIIAWLRQPHIAEFLRDYAQACNDRTRHLAATAGVAAVNTTIRCLNASNPETTRRAASTLLRQAKPAPATPRTPTTAPPPTPSAPAPAHAPDQAPAATPCPAHEAGPPMVASGAAAGPRLSTETAREAGARSASG